MDLTYLRLLVDERVPTGGSEEDTSFTDVELLAIAVLCSNSVYQTAAEVWRIKAGLIQSRMNNISSYSLGEESVSFADLRTQYDHAIALSTEYKKKSSLDASTVLSQTPPDVLHTEDEDE